MITKLFLLRHGETEWNLQNRFQGQKDSPLTALGQEQVAAAGKELQHEPIDAVYISSLGRTLHTYEILKPFLKQTHTTHISDRIVERSFGEGEGMTRAELEVHFPEEMATFKSNQYNWKLPGGESYSDTRKRASAFTDEVLANNDEKTILFITHGGVVKALLIHYLNLPLEPWPNFTIPNAGVNVLSFSKERVVWHERREIST
ncbi:MAG: histidine phosphatase family protein [bacterium]